MFELFVVACVAMRACEYVTVPITYPTEETCAQQAALLAGMVRARNPYGQAMVYEYSCTPGRRVDVAVER